MFTSPGTGQHYSFALCSDLSKEEKFLSSVDIPIYYKGLLGKIGINLKSFIQQAKLGNNTM